MLHPGYYFVPDLDPKLLDRATDQRYTFVKKTAPAKLNIQLLDQDQPRGGVAYQLEIHGVLKSGVTDGNGYIRQPLPPGAQRGKSTIATGTTQDVYEIQFGALDPADTESGVRGRLLNLGFGCDDIQEAIKAFQKKEGLTVTGEADAATKSRLQQRHGQ